MYVDTPERVSHSATGGEGVSVVWGLASVCLGPWVCTPKTSGVGNRVVLLWDWEFYMPGGEGGFDGTCGGGGSTESANGRPPSTTAEVL